MQNVLPRTHGIGQHQETMAWWERLEWTNINGSDITSDTLSQALHMVAIADKKSVVSTQFDGVCESGAMTVKNILDDLFAATERGHISAIYVPFEKDSQYTSWMYFWLDGAVHVQHGEDGTSISIMSVNPAQRDAIVEKLAPLVSKKKSKGRVFVMVAGSGGIQLRSIGAAKVDFEPTNYNEKVQKAFEYIVTDFKREKPSGRIAIFQGVPGTGKTYLIRSMVGAVENAMFVVMPASLVPNLDGPDFVNTLYNTYNKSDGPLVLIIEDADTVLAPRQGDNMHSISSLLNLSDGILGNLMDIRIVATTNATLNDLDEAVKRPGRLTKCVVVDELDYESANIVYRRLLAEVEADKSITDDSTEEQDTAAEVAAALLVADKRLPEDRKYTLAEVYQAARPDFVMDLGEIPQGEQLGF